MGLDVYLSRYKNFDKTKKVEERFNKESNKIWDKIGKEYDNMTKGEKDKASKKSGELAVKLGLDRYGADKKNIKSIELNSKKYPKHYFKIGYFRSSYNESGFNSVMGNFIGKDLYDIFKIKDNEYNFSPNWKEAKIRAKEMLKELKDKIKKDGSYRILQCRHNEFIGDSINSPIDNEKKALEKFLKIKREHKLNGFGSFSNRSGEFFLDEPLEVSGIIQGVSKRLLSNGEMPCVYVVYEDKGFDFYVQALEIIIETIDYVLKQKDTDKYYLSWSG